MTVQVAESIMIVTGPVVRSLEIRAVVNQKPDTDGMIHISRLADRRIAKVEDVVKEGDIVTVKVTKVDKDRNGKERIDLTMRPSDLKK